MKIVSLRTLYISSATAALLLIALGTNWVAAEPVNLISAGETWKYFEGSTQPSDAWKGLGYDDSAWASGPTGIGYGDLDDATVLSGMQGNYVTVYTRKTFNIESVTDVASLVLSIDYDDGFVAYINGNEIARANMPNGTITKDTGASISHEAGTPETFVVFIPSSVLVDGENVLAVEVHNDDAASSDLSCIPELIATFGSPPVSLIESGESWKYFEGIVQPASTWTGLSFDDSAWASGPTGIGYGDSDDATVLSGMQNSYLTLYARKIFTVPSAADVESLTLSIDYDDGFVAYINGNEIARGSMPSGAVNKDTPALDREAGLPAFFDISLTTAGLVDGTNVLSVETHNLDLGSSDLSFIPALAMTVSAQTPPPNGAPTANSQGISTEEDTTLTITLTGSDPDGDPITFTVVSGPSSGILSGSAPNLTYTPNINFNGADSFSFSVSDGTADSAIATVSITVTSVNDAPVLSVVSAVGVDEGASQTVVPSANDADGDVVTFSVQGITAFMSFDGVTLSITPGYEDEGSYNISFTASDGILSDTETVTVVVANVNRAPTAVPGILTTNEDAPDSVILTGSDPDGDIITFAIAVPPASGTVTLTGETAVYTPDTGFSGSDSFTFTVSDGDLTSAPATVSITVQAGVPPPVSGNTYYISPAGTDTNPGTQSAPWATFEHAFKNGMTGGDTLIVQDGVYNQGIGETFSNQPYNNYSPPSGNAEGYTRIISENDGGAVIDDQSIYLGGPVNGGVAAGSSYIHIEGLKLISSPVTIQNSHHIKMTRTSIKNGHDISSSYATVTSIRQGSHHVLLEDFWVIGVMQNGIKISESSEIILRRVLIRLDGNAGIQGKTGIRFDSVTDCWVQNTVLIDFNPAPNITAAIWHSGGTQRIYYTGCVLLNLSADGMYLNYTGSDQGHQVTQSVFWDLPTNKYAMILKDSDPAGTTFLDQLTVGNTERGTAHWSGSAGTQGTATLQNSIFFNNAFSNQGIQINDYNHYDISSQAQGTNVLTGDPGVQYLVQTPDTGTGFGGVTRGATILKQAGTSGTLWGETGYDQVTTQDLWPWPYEDRIHADAAEADGFSYPATDNNGNPYPIAANDPERGFAAPGQTLTTYIWEYLGFPIPPEIYQESPPAEAPNPPTVDSITTPTNINHQQISGTKDSNTSVWMDDGTGSGYVEIQPLDMGATWTLGLMFFEGPNTFSFIARSTENVDSTPTVVAVDLDTLSPIITLIAPGSSFATNQPSALISGNVDDSSAVVIINQEPVDLSGNSFSHTLLLDEGNNSIVVQATDLLGNASIHNSIMITRDTQGPAQPTITPPTSPTPNATQTLNGAISSDTVDLMIACSTASVDPADLELDPAAGTWSCPVAQMQQGTNTILVTAMDILDNASVPAITSIVMDGAPPPDPEVQQVTAGDNKINVPSTGELRLGLDTITLTGTAFQDTTEVLITSATAQIGTIVTEPDPAQIIRDWSVVITLAAGNNVISVQARDLSGNLSGIVTLNFYYDNEPPVIIFDSPLDGAVLGPAQLTH